MMDQFKPKPEDVQMVSVPPPPPPVSPPLGIGSQAQTGRPTAVTVIGIVLLVLAGFTLSSILILMRISGTITWSMLSLIIILIIEVVTGITLLRFICWARKGAIIGLIMVFATGMIDNLVIMKQVSMQVPSDMKTSMWTGFAPGILFSAAIYGVIIFFLSRPNVVAAFQTKGELPSFTQATVSIRR